MKKVLATICIIAIILNIYIGIFSDISEENGDGKSSGPNNPDDIIIPANFTVTVPARKINDEARYEYSLFAVMYSENKTSGEWEKYKFQAGGTLFDILSPITKKRDGFYAQHSVLNLHEETEAGFTITVEGSDSETLQAHGNLSITRDEYTDLNEKKVILTKTKGHVEIDPLPRIPFKTRFDGALRNYPNPNEVQEESLDELIYMGNKKIGLNDSDSILRIIESEYSWVSEWYTQRYNWTVEGSERKAGYSTLVINITTGFFQGFVPFYKKIWIANDASFPVKVFTRTNTSYEDENYKFYIILEHDRELQHDPDTKTLGFTRGDKKVPWGDCISNLHFQKRHPQGEFKEWNYLPVSGDKFDDSSFNLKTDDAEKFAIENSNGLKKYLNKFDDVTVTWAAYKELKDTRDELDPEKRAGKYNWNLSFGYKPNEEEAIEAWENARDYDEYPYWGYYVNISHNVTYKPGPGLDKYDESTKIINQGRHNWGDAPLSKPQIDDETVTLASSEELFKIDNKVKNRIFDNNEIDFNDLSYALAMGSITSSSMPGMEIIETITGITLPTSRYSWALQEGKVFPEGSTFSAAVDAETGQLLYVLDVTGTELYGIFGGE